MNTIFPVSLFCNKILGISVGMHSKTKLLLSKDQPTNYYARNSVTNSAWFGQVACSTPVAIWFSYLLIYFKQNRIITNAIFQELLIIDYGWFIQTPAQFQ